MATTVYVLAMSYELDGWMEFFAETESPALRIAIIVVTKFQVLDNFF